MATRPSRYRSSTSASNPPKTTKAAEVLQGLLDNLSSHIRTRGVSGYPDTQALMKYARQLHQHLAASTPPSPSQDDFRHLHGYQHILDLLRSFSGYYNPSKRTQTEKKALFELLHIALAVLSATFRGHQGNRRYFRHRVEGGGWEALEQIIASIGLGGSDSDLYSNCQLFGKLLSFALDDQRLDELCQSVASAQAARAGAGKSEDDEDGAAKGDASLQKDAEMAFVETELHNIIGPKTVLQNAEIMRTVVGFWESIPRQKEKDPDITSFVVVTALSLVVSSSFANLAALHTTGVLSRFLRLYFGQGIQLGDLEREKVLALCKSMMSLGVNRLVDAQFLLSNQDPAASEFSLAMAEKHCNPSFVQFDLSLHGHSSIELPNIGRSFPPLSSAGYTFTAWLRVDNFDPNSHTTIFGVFDSTQTCFLLAYLERDTHNFILQTSVTSQRPSVRFKSVKFKPNQWYHVAIVHRRPKTMIASKASLYVNGEFAEQLRSSYPSQPPLASGSTDSFASFASNAQKTAQVQAFLGTPRDLSTRVGPGLIFSKWSLATAHLFEDTLSDDFIAVHYRLGPRYQGNFQDRLGSFQTYEASAALSRRNEMLHPGKEENSDILRAIRDKASVILPEQKVLMGTIPGAMFRTDGQFLESLLFRSLSRNAASNLLSLTAKTGTAIAINSAIPCVNDALVRAHGVSILAGDPVLATPYNFDDNLWRLGGFTPVALKLVERTTNSDDLLRSVEFMFLCINQSWRNSEAMERDNGYAILAMLLRAKLGYPGSGPDNTGWRLTLTSEERDRLSFQLLSLVLAFVGYRHADNLESFIVNPLAYRILLIDFDTWRKAARLTQELYYKQFLTFAVTSKHHQFNNRRLVRMRVTKRLLDAVKGESISEEVLPHFLSAFETLIRCNYNAEVHRSLALFITYALHTQPTSLPRTPKPLSALSRSSTPKPLLDTNGSVSANNSKILNKRQLAVRILGMYTRMLCEKGNLTDIRKFAKTVTNKWLLYLLAENDPEIVVNGCKILARLLVSHGAGYVAKFATKTGGFTIMAHRLRNWWDIPTLWPICLCILFGKDVAEVDFDKPFDLTNLAAISSKGRIVYPEALPVLISMLQHGLRDVLRYQDDPDSPARPSSGARSPTAQVDLLDSRPRDRSMSLAEELALRQSNKADKDRISSHATVLQTMVRFLADLYTRSSTFRDFALSSEYVRLLLTALYPVIVSTDAVSPETELNSKDSALTFEGGDVLIRPVPGSALPAPIVRTASASSTESAVSLGVQPTRGTPLRKASSFILLSAQKSPPPQSAARFSHVMSPKKQVATQQVSNVVLEGLLDLVIKVFADQVMVRKEFSGFGLFLKVPPGFQEHQAYFESYVLRNTVEQLGELVRSNQKVLCEPRILTNMARLSVHVLEATFEGWFMNGALTMLDFTGMLLEYLQRPEVSSMKSVRLCMPAVGTLRLCFLKVALLLLSDIDDAQISDADAQSALEKLFYWQTVLLNCLSTEDEYMKLFWYQLYAKLLDKREPIRLVAASIWRIMLVQKPQESAITFRQCSNSDQGQLTKGFSKLTEVDDGAFVEWVDQHRPSLDTIFFGGMSKTWEDFVGVENQRTSATARSRVANRKEKLKQWRAEGREKENVLLRHEMANSSWMKSIYMTEHFRYQRTLQDQQDDLTFLISNFRRMERDLKRPGAVFAEPSVIKWKLDRTEGRNRMRRRLLPVYSTQQQDYLPKRRATDSTPSSIPLRLNTSAGEAATGQSLSATPINNDGPPGDNLGRNALVSAPTEDEVADSASESGVGPEEDFELVEDPNDAEGDDAFEDKNRKVMRRLEHGDAVQHVYNISRIIGLDACEGILIIGKDDLYIMDNVFQRADGEIVNVWQAPVEERDPFSQIITGTKPGDKEKRPTLKASDQESRNWKWSDVISISKRRFLFRDVAIEIFFRDGRSYLLTALNPTKRDEVFGKLMLKTPHTTGPNTLPNPEDAWRLEALKVFEEAPQTFGSKFGSIFNSSPWNPIMRRWQKGEISNFHYLMLVNTMAGRTFNDLTQYPVFPWVLADYMSDELDLDDPLTFRDLSKPMGAQSGSRQSDFMMRYNSLAEIGQTPFHYGTHYSSAMVVSSYLIRLPPFVDSYLLLQGGHFDHPDRLFFSIEGAWKSASRDNGSDVRELIPEFYCLPEFLTNINGYDFGLRQGGNKVDNVILPPWAKGDPKIFIEKHRQALESPYVTQNLHHWIDLVFGYKQRGDAAVENLNVFHNLSYHGAIDLDNITDPQERAIVTGIIHNFGQTPHQVFSKPHPARDPDQGNAKRLDTSVGSLTKLPYPLLESHEKVASLIYTPKIDRLLCASPFRVNLPPYYDKFLEWGYADNSIRFYFSDNRKPAGLFENLHIGQISSLTFADSKTLITAGEDCVVTVHSVQSVSGKPVELQQRSSLFGHKSPVTTMAVSKAFSTFLTASEDGGVFLWDLNRLEFIRKLPISRAVECARINDVTGDIILCSGPNVLLFTLNGELLVDQNVCGAESPDDFVQSCSFYEGAGNEWLENCLVFTGHRRGRVNVWRKTAGKNGRWALEFLRRLDHIDPKSESGANVDAAITCITPMPQLVYTGDEDGRVYEWNLIPRER
ncbi:uncharacterized protein E0L32_008383 [Thyridium curvatum]|uniref:Beige protein homolog 1 n=1 Tax=Thyridium curvatum TaxID=1093900 RepID=A0A507B045_9PEZI|nr:uncharacterized protein E0L32_008383 [Thyridium curvatum]TPX10649.1 hypothetical protein E0L32_008383 [Thyridium curvatum]